MKVSIYQPRYFPQLHYYNRALSSDIFVILDLAQYTKTLTHVANGQKQRHKSYQSDALIKLPHGSHFLTVSISHNGLLPINETKLDYSSDWCRKHKATIESSYLKSQEFTRVFPSLSEVLDKKYSTLGELNIKSFLWGLSILLGANLKEEEITIENINSLLQTSRFRLKKIILSSELGVERPEGFQKGTEWTTAICKKLGATQYLHGGTAQAGYMDEGIYKKNGVELVAQDWRCGEYPQQFNNKVGFIPNLSIIDLLMNVSWKEAQEIIK